MTLARDEPAALGPGRRRRGRIMLAVLGFMAPAAGLAGESRPDPATLLFDEPQLEATHPGDVLTYAYSRKTADDAKYGRSFSDTIALTIAAGDKADSRTVSAMMFSGANGRPAGPFPDMTGNPLLSLFLENHIGALSQQLHANPRYLKNAIRAGLRDKAEIVEAPVAVEGRSLPGWHIRMTPFRDDANKGRMLGLDAMSYDFAVARDLPGEIAEIRIVAPAPDGSILLDERVVYDAKAH